MPSIRRVAYTTITIFCIFFFTARIDHQNFAWRSLSTLEGLSLGWVSGSFSLPSEYSTGFPDFSHYHPFHTLSAEQFPIDDPNKRVIVVGDIHGMDKSLQSLLAKLSYDPTSDVLIHLGDFLTKGSLTGSLSVLSYMTSNNITGVRGNHDQKVIEWYSWLDWIAGFHGGQRWLDDVYDRWAIAESQGVELKLWIKQEKKKKRGSKWWKKIPHGWQLFSDHYNIAKAMSKAEYEYLLSLPLILHVPSAHTFFAHAGLLPSDPRYPPHRHRQPLARIPTLPSGVQYGMGIPNATIPTLRRLQEIAVLNDVPQNKDPWVALNMRGVLKDNTITRKKNGQPWSSLWNRDMSLCDGFDGFEQNIHPSQRRKDTLPCHPSTVVYGHSAARGLDVKRWTIGLDTGCIKKRRLTALVLGSSPHRLPVRRKDEADKDVTDYDDDDDDDIGINRKPTPSVIPYGDDGKGHIVSIKCH